MDWGQTDSDSKGLLCIDPKWSFSISKTIDIIVNQSDRFSHFIIISFWWKPYFECRWQVEHSFTTYFQKNNHFVWNLTDVKIQLQRQHLRDLRAKNPWENVTPTRRLCDRIQQYVWIWIIFQMCEKKTHSKMMKSKEKKMHISISKWKLFNGSLKANML